MKAAAAVGAALAAAVWGPAAPVAAQTDTPATARARAAMVERQIEARGIDDPAVLASLRTVPRHLFVPRRSEALAYSDTPLPIGEGQTISQPYIVALMTQLASVKAGDRVLEVGTGSGYQAAILEALGAEVYSIEIKPALHEQAAARLLSLGYGGVRLRRGDGYYGWPEAAPFAAIVVTAAVDHVPPPLLGQLAPGGRIVLPLGNPYDFMGQTLVVVTQGEDGPSVRQVLGVRFVPMTGRAAGGP